MAAVVRRGARGSVEGRAEAVAVATAAVLFHMAHGSCDRTKSTDIHNTKQGTKKEEKHAPLPTTRHEGPTDTPTHPHRLPLLFPTPSILPPAPLLWAPSTSKVRVSYARSERQPASHHDGPPDRGARRHPPHPRRGIGIEAAREEEGARRQRHGRAGSQQPPTRGRGIGEGGDRGGECVPQLVRGGGRPRGGAGGLIDEAGLHAWGEEERPAAEMGRGKAKGEATAASAEKNSQK